jgi:hypothetical protein
MNLVTNIYNFNENYLFFCEPIRNNIMNGGNFIRFIYSTHEMTMNGLFFQVSLENSEIEKQYNKWRCNFSVPNHKDIVNSLSILETQILNKHSLSPFKKRKNQIAEQFSSGSIKLVESPILENTCMLADKNNYLIKISGIWETESEYGLTFKFLKL